jgi:hypothetical protein
MFRATMADMSTASTATAELTATADAEPMTHREVLEALSGLLMVLFVAWPVPPS